MEGSRMRRVAVKAGIWAVLVLLMVVQGQTLMLGTWLPTWVWLGMGAASLTFGWVVGGRLLRDRTERPWTRRS
jgi:hypothetical protein